MKSSICCQTDAELQKQELGPPQPKWQRLSDCSRGDFTASCVSSLCVFPLVTPASNYMISIGDTSGQNGFFFLSDSLFLRHNIISQVNSFFITPSPLILLLPKP